MAKSFVCMIALVLVAVSGCIFGGGHDIEPRVHIRGKKMAVVPFREKDLYFLESKVGSELAGMVVQIILRETIDTRVLDPQPAFDEFVRDKNPEKIEWGKVAEKLKVDYVVVGDILLLRSRDPKRDVNLYRGAAAVQVTVWRPDNSMAFTETVTVSYPSGKYNAPVMSMFDTTEDEVLGRLKAKAALKIARLFFAYSPEKE